MTINNDSLWLRIRHDSGRLLRIAGPLITNNLAIAGMNFTDTVMAGNISVRDLAAVGVGNALYFAFFLFALGTLMAMSPITAQSLGAGRDREVGPYARQALYVSQLLAVLVIGLMLQAGVILAAIGIVEDIRPLAARYIEAILFGSPAVFAFLALRFVSEGLGHTRPIAHIAMMSLLFNAIANYILMFGKLGFPALGAVGCGYATALTQWLMLAAMCWYICRDHREIYAGVQIFSRFDWPSPGKIWEILRLGVPIGIGTLAEAGLFSAAAMLMGRIGSAAAGAHQVAINYAATMFMVPLGIHSATMALVGRKAGNRDLAGARFTGFIGIGLCTVFMAISAVLMLVFRGPIIGFYNDDPAVREIAFALLGMAALFQVSDGVQVGAMGALRGLKDTARPMLLSVFSYWGIGFSMAWYTVVIGERGPVWVWGALAAGLTVAAVVLTVRFAWITRTPGAQNV